MLDHDFQPGDNPRIEGVEPPMKCQVDGCPNPTDPNVHNIDMISTLEYIFGEQNVFVIGFDEDDSLGG